MSRIDACYAHLVFSPCAVSALLEQDSIGAAGIPWWLRHSCHPMQLARNSVHKCPKPTLRGRFRRFVYTPTASFRAVGPDGRGLRALAQPPPQPGGGLLERICPVGPLFIVPRRLAGGYAPRPRAATSRKGAFCATRRPQTAPFREASGGMRLSARPRGPPPQPRRRPPQVGPGNRRAPAAARDVAADARPHPCE